MTTKSGPARETMALARCGCQHEYQDARYGPGMRQHTIGGKSVAAPLYRCTVCGREKTEIIR